MKNLFLLIKPKKSRSLRSLKLVEQYYLLPHIITIGAICSGMIAIKYAILGKFNFAMLSLLVATILDMLDGKIARLLKASSSFGEQLDSLADFANFGVAPSLIIYKFFAPSPLLWCACLVYTSCAALRLARFNSTPQATCYFIGVPTTISALLSTASISIFLAFNIKNLFLATLLLTLCGFLMISNLYTFSLKKFYIPKAYFMPILALIGAIIGLVVYFPWHILSLLAFVYLISLPLIHINLKQKYKNL